MTRPRKIQLACGLIAVACLLAAGLVQETQQTRSDLWEILPGRAFFINYFWIRATRMQDEGRYYDAMQQAQTICRLQRKYPDVWWYHAWNMSFNISVTTHTAEERWRWVYNGIRLLRDEAIPLNPDSLMLYENLGWIFLFKIGRYLDDAHWVYKRQWASRMQDLLGAPPQGTSEETLDALRPIAAAPLDKTPRFQGREIIQAAMRDKLLADPKVRSYAEVLAELGVGVDQMLLDAYNRFSLDRAVRVVRIAPPQPRDEAREMLFAAVNDPLHAEARGKLLAFVRAQVLWNVYRMDPAFMVEMMEAFGPLDWRLPQSHCIYWVKLGQRRAKDARQSDYRTLNAERHVLVCLKELCWRGRLTMIDLRGRSSDRDTLSLEPVRAESDMRLPQIEMFQWPDPRYIEPTQKEYLEAIARRTGGNPKRFKSNSYRDGHVNFLADAVKMLYAGYRRTEAQRKLDWIRENYQPTGGNWGRKDVLDFIVHEMQDEQDINRDLAEAQIGTSLMVGLVAHARGDVDSAGESLRYAHSLHQAYQKGLGKRLKVLDFSEYLHRTATELLALPRIRGYNLSLLDRSELYKALQNFEPFDAATLQAIYDSVREPLEIQCENEGVDFQTAFPPPPKPQQQRQGAKGQQPAAQSGVGN